MKETLAIAERKDSSNAAGIVLACTSAAIAIVGFIWVVWRLHLPLEIDPNESWNAWWADAAFSGTGLYPDPQGIIANNYPPLYFIVLHVASKLAGANAIDAGRYLSLTSIGVIAANIFLLLRTFGHLSRLTAAAGALWLLALFSTYFSRYAGMNDPQFTAIAVMLVGLVVVLRSPDGTNMLLAGTALMVAAGFIKHSLWAMPLSLFVYMIWTAPRRALVFAATGMVLAAVGLAVCLVIWGDDFVQQLMMPRHASWTAAVGQLDGMSWFVVAAILFAWSGRGSWHQPFTRFTAIFLVIAFLVDVLQRRGDGVDVNAEMELALASAMATAHFIHKLGMRTSVSGRTKGVIATAMLLPLIIALPPQALQLYNTNWRNEALSNAARFDVEQKRISEIRTPVVCFPASLCYRAGQPNVYDYFITHQRVKTGTWSQGELEEKIAKAALVFDTPDAKLGW